MIEINKLKSMIKNNKNVFKDNINDMTIKSSSGNNIIFSDFKGNEITAEINGSDIISRFDDKNKYVKATETSRDFLERKLGIPYKEFDKLDCDEQHKILQAHKKSLKPTKKDEVLMMIGSGEHSTFIKVKKGERIMLSDGNFVEAGLTPEESKRRLDDKMDDMLYSKPVALVKKISRKFKK